jgi:hypothetical protein
VSGDNAVIDGIRDMNSGINLDSKLTKRQPKKYMSLPIFNEVLGRFDETMREQIREKTYHSSQPSLGHYAESCGLE